MEDLAIKIIITAYESFNTDIPIKVAVGEIEKLLNAEFEKRIKEKTKSEKTSPINAGNN